MNEPGFENTVERIVKADPRFAREAYTFVREALDYTQKKIAGQSPGKRRHVTGQELLEGIREYALESFGPMAHWVLTEWGVHQCADFGEIVFNMIDAGLLSKTESDQRSDFAGGYDFHKAFCEPFLPRSKRAARPPPQARPTLK